jgi:hypothetical protein
MSHELKDISFLQAPTTKYMNNIGKCIHKRNQVKGGRAMVGARLTAEQVAKLEDYMSYYTANTGIQATISSVIATLVDELAPRGRGGATHLP